MFETDSINVITCEVGVLSTNCYIVINKRDKKAVIIDPGEQANKIKERITELDVTPVAILLTHGHFDHIMAVKDLVEFYNIRIYISEQERELVNNIELNLSRHFRRDYACKADVYLMDNQVAEIAGIKFKVINTPGHTVGSCCYYIEENDPLKCVLFSGDTLFCQSVGRTDFPTGSAATLSKSIKERLMVLPDEVKVFPGHGPATTIGFERFNGIWF